MWTIAGRHNLVRELHAQQLTTSEIQRHLAAGKTSTRQVVNLGLNRIRFIQHKLGLRPHRLSARRIPLGKKAAEFKREGRSIEWIARHFNEQAFTSPKGKSWTPRMVYDLIATVGEKVETLGDIHRKAIMEARARGLSYREMAMEFNEKRTPRRKDSCGPWTALKVANTCSKLNLLQRDSQQEIATTESPESVILKKSA
jgi:hypothetical protein